MLKSLVNAPIHGSLPLHMTESASHDRPLRPSSLKKAAHVPVNFITFNQDASCVAVGLGSGFKIFSCSPFRQCFHQPKSEAVGLVEMLYCTSLVAVVALGDEPGSSPRKLKLINTKRHSTICDLIFPSSILQVKLSRSRMVVLLEGQIYVYEISTMKLLHTIETSPNVNGLCTLSNDDVNPAHQSYLAYPLPPKTVTHDSLLVNGINTNGGLNSAQNNVLSVSNTPNRVGDVIIFNLRTLQPMSVIEAHKSTLAAITLSSDGSLLATASDKGTIVRVFAVATGVKLYQFRRGTYPTNIYSLSFSSDNRYVVATSSSETVHIFRLGEDESLETKHKKKMARSHTKKSKLNPDYETITEETEEETGKPRLRSLDPSTDVDVDVDGDADDDDDGVIQDDGDDSDADDDEDHDDNESMETAPKQRKLSQGSLNSFTSIMSGISNFSNEDGTNTGTSPKEPKTEPIVDQTRLSVARMIRRSSQTLGRKAAQKMGDFLPSRFSSILEPTRHFASLKINGIGRDIKSIAIMGSDLQEDQVPTNYLGSKDVLYSPSNPPHVKDNYFAGSSASSVHSNTKDLMTLNLIHISVLTSEGFFYVYGLDPERGGDCILLQQYSLVDEGL